MAAPKTVVLDGAELADIRQRVQGGNDATLQTALKVLTADADKWLEEGPWSVMMKKKAPPSGDMHDYTSQAPYWWPNPDTSDGSPYIERDGKKNPEVLEYSDRVYAEKVFLGSYSLALAWFYTGNEAYGKHAGDIIRMWFVTPKTRMNPNLNHAQLIPFANTGRHIGIIDFSQWYTSVLDAAALLDAGAPGWERADMEGFREWNRGFLRWLVDSPFGQAEHAQQNNHGSFAAMLTAAVALFVGDEATARREAEGAKAHLEATIRPDGSVPAELRRTRSWHYTAFNLLALTRLAATARKVGVDLWAHPRLTRAMEYVIPAATGSEPWAFPELNFKAYAAADIIRAAAAAGHEMSRRAVERIQTPPEGDVWPLRPAPEQLDAVKVDN